ncbi:MAG: hypothetical protein HQ464_04575 [Planctomycetes bacterium]|nr:hypothetical protein [Planctomycetota bacterium]
MTIRSVGRRISQIFKARKARKGISFFEVKELYNLAYDHKAQARSAIRQYRRMEAKAQAMDEAYRAQLGLVRRSA